MDIPTNNATNLRSAIFAKENELAAAQINVKALRVELDYLKLELRQIIASTNTNTNTQTAQKRPGRPRKDPVELADSTKYQYELRAKRLAAPKPLNKADERIAKDPKHERRDGPLLTEFMKSHTLEESRKYYYGSLQNIYLQTRIRGMENFLDDPDQDVQASAQQHVDYLTSVSAYFAQLLELPTSSTNDYRYKRMFAPALRQADQNLYGVVITDPLTDEPLPNRIHTNPYVADPLGAVDPYAHMIPANFINTEQDIDHTNIQADQTQPYIESNRQLARHTDPEVRNQTIGERSMFYEMMSVPNPDVTPVDEDGNAVTKHPDAY